MKISMIALEAEYRRAKRDWPFIAEVERAHGLPPYALYAVGSRETNLTNEVGDFGHGRGVWQLDDRSHTIPGDWMSNVREQAEVAATMLADGNRRCGSWIGSYNAYNSGRCATETTTGHDYGPDVEERRRYLLARFGEPGASRRREDDEP